MAQVSGYVKKVTWKSSTLSVVVGPSVGLEQTLSLSLQTSDSEEKLAGKQNMGNLLTKAKTVGCLISIGYEHQGNSDVISSITFDALIDPEELKKNIVIATETLNAYFGCDGVWGGCTPLNIGEGLSEEQVNSFFVGTAPWHIDCLGAARIIMARGLILTLHEGEFKKLGYTSSKMKLINRPITKAADMQIGEWAYFKNDPKYLTMHPGGGYQGENVIKVSQSEYYGFPVGKNTEGGWVKTLITAYNSGLPQGQQITSIPGFQGQNNYCIDVKAVSLDLVKLRYS